MIAATATLLCSVALCGLYLLVARRLQLVDRPNERSSHHRPTPHGGGLPLLLAFALGVALAATRHGPWETDYLVLLAGALFLMLVGVLDDLRGLSVTLRMALYGLTCLLVTIWLLARPVSDLTWLLTLAGWTLALLWSLNLYNFMDGIDGLAATQSILACTGAARLSASCNRSCSNINKRFFSTHIVFKRDYEAEKKKVHNEKEVGDAVGHEKQDNGSGVGAVKVVGPIKGQHEKADENAAQGQHQPHSNQHLAERRFLGESP